MNLDLLQSYISKNIDPELRELWVNIYKQMIVHTRGQLPTELLEINRPNEPKDIKKYRIDTYFPITRDPIEKGLNSTTHLIKQSDYKTVMSDDLRKYLAVTTFESAISINRLNIYDLIFRSFLQIDIEDPNGVMLALPINPNGGTPNELAPNESPIFEFKYVASKYIKYIDNKVLIYESGEAIIGDSKAKHKVYTVVDKDDIVIMKPTRYDNEGKIIYEAELYYRVNLNFAPFRVLGGIETIRDKESKTTKEVKDYKLFDTYFTAYNSWANYAIIAMSETTAVKQRFSYPQVEMIASPCRTCKGAKTMLQGDCLLNKCNHERGQCTSITCSDCGGRGTQIYSGPFGVIMKDPPKAIEGNVQNDVDTIKYYSPPSEGITINKEWLADMTMKMEQSISVYQSASTTASGVSKEYDLEQKRDFISVIGDNQMNLLEFALQCLAAYRFDKEVPHVIKPKKYELRDKDDILTEIGKVNVIDKSLSKGLAQEYVEKEYDGIDRRVMDLLIENDIYYGYNLDELSKLKAMQMLSTSAFDFHIQGFKAIYSILSEEANRDKTNEQIIQLANDKIIPTVPNGNGFSN
jgi:hypothetical protein